MKKYNLLPQILLDEKIVEKGNFFAPELIDEKYILLAHKEAYWDKLRNLAIADSDFRKIGFPQSEEVVLRERYLCEGTRKSADYAIDFGVSFNIAGGTHHAFSYKGEGFCILNDMAIAAHYLLDSRKANSIMIIDLDVHQGNGTAEIFKNEDRVFTLSLHGKNNYPLKKEISDLDIELPDAINDEEYLELLNHALSKSLDRFQPDFIFYQCGVDILESDKFGRLGVSIEGCKKRDEIILKLAKNNNIPIACSMGGGYSPDINVIINAHSNTYKLAKEIFSKQSYLLRYYVINKPFLMLSQFSKEGDLATLADLYSFPKDVYPLGRLDSDSEGLLIITNDKKLNALLLDPKHNHKKTYLAQVEGTISNEAIEMLKSGVEITVKKEKYQCKAKDAKILEESPTLQERNPPIRERKNIPTSFVEITISEGKNRQVRKMLASVGYPVLRLIRTSIEDLALGSMQSGEVMEISRNQLYKLLRINTDSLV